MLDRAGAIQLLADGLALVYHEARHVRFLTTAGHLPLEPWAAFIDLPRSRIDAWRAILPWRKSAAQQTSGAAAAEVFRSEYERTAAELAVLFAHPQWAHTEALGGPVWGRVVAFVLTLRDTIDSEDLTELLPACARLTYARHTEGRLRVKIAELDRAVNFGTSPLWRSLPTPV
jgi:hypothetical protein